MADVVARNFKQLKAQKTFDLDGGSGLRLATTSYQLGRHLELGLCSGIELEEDWATNDPCGTVRFDYIYMETTQTITKVMLGMTSCGQILPQPFNER